MAKKGSKLVKSESVQVRFDPILKMAAELAASRERRTMSSFTEIAVEQAVKQSVVARDKEGNPMSAWQVAYQCWSESSLDRLCLLAEYYPDLLTIKERKILRAIDLLFSKSGAKNGQIFALLSGSNKTWETLCRYADSEITFDELLPETWEFRRDLSRYVIPDEATPNPS